MRYIGCKTKLLDIIDKEICDLLNNDFDGKVFCDLFSGTCSVGDRFQNRCKVIANDSLYFSYIISRGKLLKHTCTFETLGFDPFEFFNNQNTDNYLNGYCYNNFAPTVSGRQYFSDENAKLIDFIRETIDIWYSNGQISENEKDYLIACLLESCSKVSNVAGVYAAFLHVWDSRAVKKMVFIPVESQNIGHFDNEVFNEDVNSIIKKISGDILYLDPPYTPTQYISQYHVLETIAKNDHPVTHGIGAHRDNGTQISNWCKKYNVAYELEQLISNANFEYIVMSYSDAGIMSKDIIESIFKRYAVPGTFVFKKINFIKYKNTRAVNKEERENTKNTDHYEWLFMMKKSKEPKFISPLNYIGGKYDVLDFLKLNINFQCNNFYDLFGGGSTVSLNFKSTNNIYNDNNFIVRELLKYLAEHEVPDMYSYIDKTIKKFNLSKKNKNAYVEFRAEYNSKPIKERKPLDLYLLICFGFEHQIRFNGNLEFNNPCGNSGFNDEMLEKLISFNLRAKELKLKFYSKDYSDFLSEINEGDFVYCDPPYLLTCGAYNDGKRGFNGWDLKQQNELLSFLDKINEKNVKFALSNIIERDGNTNEDLTEWAKKNGYRIIKNKLITKRNRQDRQEILIVNY